MKSTTSALAVLAAISAMPAFAQGFDEPFDLGTLTLGGLVSPTEGATDISAEELREEQATTIDEAFRRQPGVTGLQGPGRQFGDLNIRGSEGAGAVIVSVDGAEKNLVQTLHGVDFNPIFFNPDFLVGATIVKGPASNVLGTGSTGGRVDFRTVDPSDFLIDGQTTGGRVGLTYESNGPGYGAHGIGAFQISDATQGLVGLSYREFESYDDGNGDEVLNSGSEISGALAKLVFAPTAQTDIELIYQYNRTEFIGSNVFGRANTRQDIDVDNEVDDQSFTAQISHVFDNGFELDANAFVSQTERLETILEIRSGSRGEVGDFDLSETTSVGTTVVGTTYFDTGAASHKLQFGGSVVQNELDYSSQPGGTPSEASGERSTFGIFVQDNIEINNFEIIPGLRYEAYEVDTTDSVAVDGGELLPKLTLAYGFDRGVEIYGSYARGLRSPRLNELQESSGRTSETIANPDLEAETSDAYEVGMRFDQPEVWRDGDNLSFSVAVYRNDFDNRIEEVSLSDTQRQLQNVGSAFTQGLELQADYDAGRFYLGLAFETIKGENNETGEELNSVRPNNGIVYGGLRFVDNRLTIGAEYEFFDAKTELDENEVVGEDSEAGELFNLVGSYLVNDQVSVNARVNNVLDEDYRKFDQIDQGQGINGKIDIQFIF